MRHRKLRRKLNRTTEHRLAMLRNLASSLIEHEKVRTTEPKAKAVRPLVERMVTLGKDGTLAARRRAFATLCKKQAVHKLFTVYNERFSGRAGGYTRIVKDGVRAGDGAPMAVIEFVDREIIIETQEEKDAKKSRVQRAREMRRQMLKQQRRT
jgi:large subunit ribosomal protein L17